jgi:hypothetical protein
MWAHPYRPVPSPTCVTSVLFTVDRYAVSESAAGAMEDIDNQVRSDVSLRPLSFFTLSCCTYWHITFLRIVLVLQVRH